MLDINLVRENPDLVRQSLADRQMDSLIVDEVLELDVRRRSLLSQAEALKAERNSVSKEIGQQKDPTSRQVKIEAMRLVGERISALDDLIRQVEADLQARVAVIPNIPATQTPLGINENENVVLRGVGAMPEYNFTPLPHWELGTRLGIIDFDRWSQAAACLDRLDARPAQPPGL
jgi:seryl-tRNA synthetase